MLASELQSYGANGEGEGDASGEGEGDASGEGEGDASGEGEGEASGERGRTSGDGDGMGEGDGEGSGAQQVKTLTSQSLHRFPIDVQCCSCCTVTSVPFGKR